MPELAYMSLTEVATLLEKRELSPVELTRRLLERIDRVDTHLHSYRTVLADRAFEQARRAEEEIARRVPGPLAWRPNCGQGPGLHGRHPDSVRLHADAGLAAGL